MRFTNEKGYPEALIRAAYKRNSLYNANADKSATGLINPPQIDILRQAHFKDLVKPIEEEFFGLFGSAIHKVLEWGAEGEATEERLYARINGWTISGQMDLQRTGEAYSIIDYKFCAAYSITKNDGAKPEWEAQLNIYAYLVWLNKAIRVTELAVCAIVRDWSRQMAAADLTYPQSIITMVPLRLWSLEEQEAYVRQRVATHQQAKFAYEIGEALPECTAEERWAAADKWTVTFKGLKKGKNFQSEAEAKAYGEADKKGREFEIVRRSGKSVRCNYCQVSQWCDQFKKMSMEAEGDDDDEGHVE